MPRWDPLEICLDIPDCLSLTPSECPTAPGFHYWDLSAPGVRSRFRIWSGELFGVLDALTSLNTPALVDTPWQDGFNPLSWHHSASGGIIIGVYVRGTKQTLSIRRLSSKFTNDQGNTGYSGLFRYATWGRRRTLSQGSIDLQELTRAGPRKQIQGLCRTIRQRLSELVDQEFGSEIPLDAIRQHILLSGTIERRSGDQIRRMSFDCGLPNLSNLEISHHPTGIINDVLKVCSTNCSRQEIIDRTDQMVDENALRSHLNLFTRYDSQAIRLGFWVSPQPGARTHAILERASFLSDPLLTSLTGINPRGIQGSNWASLPQYPTQRPPPFERLMENKQAWFVGTTQFALGKTPEPSPERVSTLRRLAKPGNNLKQRRWQILQMLQAQGAILSNRSRLQSQSESLSTEIVLDVQKHAILLHDAQEFFPDNESFPEEVQAILEEGRQVYEEALTGTSTPRLLRNPSTLPRPGLD